MHEAKPSDADLKQMYAYQNYWKTEKTMLLYPQVYGLADKKGIFKLEQKECSVGFVNILDYENNLNKQLGEELLAKMVEHLKS